MGVDGATATLPVGSRPDAAPTEPDPIPVDVRSVLLRRDRTFEPTGRWKARDPDLAWPDTMVPRSASPWALRILFFAGLVLGQITFDGSLARRAIGAAAMVLLVVFTEWWLRWDLRPQWRRVVVLVVVVALVAIAVAATPLAGIAAWVGYALCASMFTGPVVVPVVGTFCVVMTATQVGGWPQLTEHAGLSVVLWVVNVALGLAVITVTELRERTVLRRTRYLARLAVERERTARLRDELVEQARRTGVLDERARLARELHDTVAQALVAVVTQLESLDDDALADADRTRVDRAKRLAREGLDDARRAVRALRPLALREDSLPGALRRMADDASGDGTAVNLRVEGAARPIRHDDTIVRVVQEALANCARHARATTVVVTLTYLDDEVLVDVRDDGIGFDPAALHDTRSGFGMRGMAERMRAVGGRFTVESEPGAGCVVSAAVRDE